MKASFIITGGTPLDGSVRAAGSKNAALPMMAASLLTDEPVVLDRVPRLTDVATLARLLDVLGVEVQNDGSRYTLRADDPHRHRAPHRLVQAMRASFCVLGPMVARRRRAVVPLPGGCRIGPRPVDLHLKGLAALGAELSLAHGYVVARAQRLRGARIDLSGPAGSTVTGTANILSAAVLARGETVIDGAAREPEIVALGEMLVAMGARVDGLGTSRLRVRGVDQLGGARRTVPPDRIETATLLAAAAITGGRVRVTETLPEHVAAVSERLGRVGATLESGDHWIELRMPGRPRPTDVTALPYPGVPTDVQAQLTALLCLADGRSRVRDAVFPERTMHVPELRRLGARIEQRGGDVQLDGVARLSGATVTATELRGSAALVLAGLAARGRTHVEQIAWLDRGYERLDQKLRALGARIERVEPSITRNRLTPALRRR